MTKLEPSRWGTTVLSKHCIQGRWHQSCPAGHKPSWCYTWNENWTNRLWVEWYTAFRPPMTKGWTRSGLAKYSCESLSPLEIDNLVLAKVAGTGPVLTVTASIDSMTLNSCAARRGKAPMKCPPHRHEMQCTLLLVPSINLVLLRW